MEFKPKNEEKIRQLMNKGVHISNPLSLDVGEEVNIDHISGHGVRIYPGCRIYGEKTVISAGSQIGSEGPVTIENCQLGRHVQLKGGFFKEAVFLDKASMGLGAHVREGCILEEQANCAHCVGLKQTILFPFVTLGSLVNFCDCLMAGGTDRKNHSEVGSAYIHFNFTPDGHKATASLIGDVPRGVMLNQSPIFLGGLGGIVGPVRLGFGNVTAAGTILRNDVLKDHKLIAGSSYRKQIITFIPSLFLSLPRILKNNVIFMGNLLALEQWYIHVRRLFFDTQEFGDLIYAGLLDKIDIAKSERIKWLRFIAENIPASSKKTKTTAGPTIKKKEFIERIDPLCELFTNDQCIHAGIEYRDRFLSLLDKNKDENDRYYLENIISLPSEGSLLGTQWLDSIINMLTQKAAGILPSFKFKDTEK